VSDCDAVVIGSGPGGATTAEVLTAAGWSVVMLEKGRNHLIDTTAPFEFRRHFSNDELAQTRRYLLGPDPMLEPRVYRDTVGEVNNLPSTVGGGGVHADAKLPRFREEDFALASTRGVIDGALIEDWPFGYDELEPHYAAVERSLGVAGEPSNPFAAPRRDPFPMPPGDDMPFALVSGAAAQRHGLHPYRAPTGVNSVDYDGRPPCVDCGYCGGYGCPIHAKGDPISSLQRSLQTGRMDLRSDAYVTSLVLSDDGKRATGVRYLDLTSYPTATEVEVRAARAVIIAGGAFETPRLLLRCGIGGDNVGRDLTYHYQTFTVGIFDVDTGGERGRSVTHLHDDLMIDTPEMRAVAADAGLPWVRGGTTEHGAGQHPISEALNYGRGEHHLPSMQDSALRRRLWAFTMQGEDLPQATNRLELDGAVKDAWGFPAGRVTYVPHQHELVASAYAADLHERVMKEAGATAAFSATSPRGDEPPESRHVMGTARMGTDPRVSVVSADQHLWDVDNVYVCDSSVFVTSAGYNPTLTLAALSHRAATKLVS
jgi:gluconate 2-dehydrogenase alpha chain